MSKIGKVAGKLREDKKRILEAIEKGERHVRDLYELIVEDMVRIGKKSKDTSATTIKTDLEDFARELSELLALTENSRLKTHLNTIIASIKSFVYEYTRSGSLYTSQDQRIRSIIVFIENTLRNTVLKDLNLEYMDFRDLEDRAKRAA